MIVQNGHSLQSKCEVRKWKHVIGDFSIPLLGYQFSMGHMTSPDQGFSSTRGKSLGTRLHINNIWCLDGLHHNGRISNILCLDGLHHNGRINNILCLNGLHHNGRISNILCLDGLRHNGRINNILCLDGLHHNGQITSVLCNYVSCRLKYGPYNSW